MIKVTKRNGKREDYDVQKIKKSIEFACNGLDVNPLELESKIDQFLRNGIKTSDIQQNIIQHAIQLATPQNPDWLRAAGKALAMDLWADYKYRNESLYSIVQNNVKRGVFDKSLLEDYSEDDIKVLEGFIQNERDLEHSVASLITVKSKYLADGESNQIMHLVNAMRFAQKEPKETRIAFVKDAYDILSKREFSLATPFMSNLRKGGNVASCFIIAVEDDLNSIFENVHRVAKISKNGGGIGIFLGYLRAKGSSVNGADNAAGSVVQWVKIFNDTLVAVNQGGKRAGAGTVALPIWHNDIQDFLDLQTEHGDVRAKAYDVFPQVTVPDIFMQRDKQQLHWTTFCPFEVKEVLGIDIRGLYEKDFEEAYLKIEKAFDEGKLKVARRIENARSLTKIIMRTQFETGLPYMFFSDTVNRVNPNKNDIDSFGIPCGNLCQESYSNVVPDKYGHVCNLGSINMGNIKDLTHLAKVSRIACRMLNRGVDLTNNPDDITKAHNKRFRTIGLGVMGLHDYFAREHKNYSDKELIKEIFECIQYNAALESVELVKDYGVFDAFEYSSWKDGSMIQRFKENSSGNYDWDLLQGMIDKVGIANSQLTSPAPTTSTSIYQDASASVLPVFSAFFSENNKNGSLYVSAKYLKDNPLGYAKTQPKFSAIQIIDAVAEMQKFIDTGVSMELIFDQNKPEFKAKDLYDAIHHAHSKGIKTIYYIRSIKKNEEAKQAETACVACSG